MHTLLRRPSLACGTCRNTHTIDQERNSPKSVRHISCSPQQLRSSGYSNVECFHQTSKSLLLDCCGGLSTYQHHDIMRPYSCIAAVSYASNIYLKMLLEMIYASIRMYIYLYIHIHIDVTVYRVFLFIHISVYQIYTYTYVYVYIYIYVCVYMLPRQKTKSHVFTTSPARTGKVLVQVLLSCYHSYSYEYRYSVFSSSSIVLSSQIRLL